MDVNMIGNCVKATDVDVGGCFSFIHRDKRNVIAVHAVSDDGGVQHHVAVILGPRNKGLKEGKLDLVSLPDLGLVFEYPEALLAPATSLDALSPQPQESDVAGFLSVSPDDTRFWLTGTDYVDMNTSALMRTQTFPTAIWFNSWSVVCEQFLDERVEIFKSSSSG